MQIMKKCKKYKKIRKYKKTLHHQLLVQKAKQSKTAKVQNRNVQNFFKNAKYANNEKI